MDQHCLWARKPHGVESQLLELNEQEKARTVKSMQLQNSSFSSRQRRRHPVHKTHHFLTFTHAQSCVKLPAHQTCTSGEVERKLCPSLN